MRYFCIYKNSEICAWWWGIFVCLLSACGPTPPDLVRSVDAVQVPVPVRERCIAASDVPAVPPSRIPKAGDLAQRAAGVSAEVRALRAYAESADRLLRQCAGPAP